MGKSLLGIFPTRESEKEGGLKQQKPTIRRSAATRGERLRCMHSRGKAKIGHFDFGVRLFGLQQQVLRLQVSVGNPLPVNKRHGFNQNIGQIASILFRVLFHF